MATPKTLQAAIADLVAQATETKKAVHVVIKSAPSVGLYAFQERTGPKGGVKPVGVGAGLTIPGKKPVYFYNEKTVVAFLDTLSAPKDTPIAKALVITARAVESYIASQKPEKKGAVKDKELDI